MDLLASLPPGVEPPKDVVSQKVFINGTELNPEVALSQITVNKSFNKIAFAKMVFLDGSSSDQDFPLSNDDKFKPGSTIKVQLGYHGELDTVFEGIIVRHGIKIRPQGSALLMIEAKDKAIKLTMTRKSAYHLGKKDSEVIEELAGELDHDVDPTKVTHDQLVQYDATDWDFIVTRAEANGMLVLTDDGKLIVKKPSAQSPVVSFTYGTDIWELEAEMDARRQVQEVSSIAWDFTKQKMPDPAITGEATFSEPGDISSDDLGAVLGAKIKLNHSGYLKEDQLHTWSDAYAMRNKLSKASGRVRIEGKATLKPGDVVTLKGVGNRFNGNIFITGILHHYEGHWQTDIQFGWRDEWFYKKENVMDKPAGGLLPGINGLQIGVVVTVKDEEKVGEFRVKVHVPTITSGNKGIWARVAALNAGKERGSFFRPETGDEVVLGFLNDDPRDPIILGYLHSKTEHASPLKDGDLQYGFVSKEKLKLIFDDKNQKLIVSVPGASGEKTITLSKTAMELKDENQNSITMDTAGITIKAGKILTLKGNVVKIN
ncbi:MAG: type VI secretion system tip protein VgrG [Chitinophagaceae bacterium]